MRKIANSFSDSGISESVTQKLTTQTRWIVNCKLMEKLSEQQLQFHQEILVCVFLYATQQCPQIVSVREGERQIHRDAFKR